MAELLFIILTTFLLFFTLSHSHITPDPIPETEPDLESDATNILLPIKIFKSKPEHDPNPESIPDSILLDKESLNTIPSTVVTLRRIDRNLAGYPWLWLNGHRHGHRCRHKRHHHHHHLRHQHATWGGRVFGREMLYGDDMIGNMHGDVVLGDHVRRIPKRWVKVHRERPMSYGTWYKLHGHEKKEKHAGGIFKSIRKFLHHL